MTLNAQKKQTVMRLTTLLMITVMTLFVVLVLLGLVMRMAQGSLVQLPPDLFYAIMTLHGLGMAGTLFVGGIAALWYLLSEYVDVSVGLMKFNFVLVVAGVLGLVTATLIGRFGPGWYVLYPLPFLEGAWPRWSVATATISVMLLGVAWLLWQLDILRAILTRYGVGGFLGWKYFGKAEGEEVPPIILIASVSCIAGSLTTVFGAVMLMLYLLQWINPEFQWNALLLKNIVFLFGHTIVNITMYFGLAFVYELLPKYTNRPWKTNRIIAIAWNSALIFVIFAYFHHLYMDFAQPTALHFIGQVASYLSTVPATVVTIFGAIGQFHRSGMRMTFVPAALGFSLMGWLIGGFIAVVDSTIAVNNYFHNTLWVTSHFHTYFLMGFVLMLFAFIYHYFESDSEGKSKIALWSMLIGGYGIILMFAVAGVESVPRRYAEYADIPYKALVSVAQSTAVYSSLSAVVLLAGVGIFYTAVLGRIGRKW
jgi:cytochrome c oxidase subunit 1